MARRARVAQGQATVELAASLMVLLLVTVAMFEFGFAVYDQITLSAAARAGARAGSLAGLTQSQADTAATQAVDSATAQLFDCPIESVSADDGQSTPGQMTVAVVCSYHLALPLLGAGVFALSARGLDPVQS